MLLPGDDVHFEKFTEKKKLIIQILLLNARTYFIYLELKSKTRRAKHLPLLFILRKKNKITLKKVMRWRRVNIYIYIYI